METWHFVFALLLVLANGFFIAAEFAMVKVRSTQIIELAEQGSIRAKMAKKLLRHTDAYLPATQIGITLSSLALGWIGGPAFHRLIEPLFSPFAISDAYARSISGTIAFVIIAVVHIVLGSLAPKTLAIQKPVGTALWTAHLLQAFYTITYPAIWLLNGASRRILQLFGIHPTTGHAEIAHSPEQMRLILASSDKAAILSDENREIIEGVFQFSRRTARQIMVPRMDVVFLSTTRSIEENLETIRTTRHTRYPLCGGSLDDTVGLIHVKDLLLAQLRGPGRSLLELRREVLFVPENSTVDSLLQQFIESKTHMAVVLDEYGGASGIVSLENITEELFGQIQDEFDRERQEIEPLGNGRYRVRGDYLIEDLADRLKIDAGEPDEETVGGFVAARLGREVLPGDNVALGDLTITVLESERFRVRWVMAEATHPPVEVPDETPDRRRGREE